MMMSCLLGFVPAVCLDIMTNKLRCLFSIIMLNSVFANLSVKAQFHCIKSQNKSVTNQLNQLI